MLMSDTKYHCVFNQYRPFRFYSDTLVICSIIPLVCYAPKGLYNVLGSNPNRIRYTLHIHTFPCMVCLCSNRLYLSIICNPMLSYLVCFFYYSIAPKPLYSYALGVAWCGYTPMLLYGERTFIYLSVA